MSKHFDDSSTAGDPRPFRLSVRRLRRVEGKGLFPLGWLLPGLGVPHVDRFREHLQFGDTRAAVVLSLEPLLIAAYTDELDCVAVLRFDERLLRYHELEVGSRLVTVNTYGSSDRVSADLDPGPGDTRNWTNFHPLIVDLLSDDVELIQGRRGEIEAEEWARCREQGDAYREAHPGRAREGAPSQSWLVAAGCRMSAGPPPGH